MFDAGSVVGRLILDTSSFDRSAVNASRKIENLGASIVSTTRQLTRVASTMTFLGASITAPIILAFKSAEKYSNPAREEIQKMNNAFIGLRVSIAESLLPIMHTFGNAIADLAQRWQALSPALRESMLRTALLTGVFLTLGGVVSMVILKIVMLIGYVIKLAGAFAVFAAVNPVLLVIYIAIAAVVMAMFKWKTAGDLVMNTLQILFNMAKIGLNSILYITNSLTSAFFAATTGALKLAAATTAPWNKEAKKHLEDLASGAWKLAQQYTELANTNLKNIADAGKNTFEVLTTGQSDFSMGFDDLKTQAQALIDLFKNLGSQEIKVKNWEVASKTFAQGWRDAFDKINAELHDWGTMAGSIVQGVASGMQTSISNFLMNIKDYFNGSKNFFVEFGNFILKILADVIAQIVTAKIIAGIGSIASNWGGGTATVSGKVVNTAPANYYLGSHAEGTDSIPYTGNYRLHEGEKVTPKYDANKSGAIELTIINQITPEAVATAMSGKEGSGVIVNTINTSALLNGSSRRTIRRK
jgi:hypothetical protein